MRACLLASWQSAVFGISCDGRVHSTYSSMVCSQLHCYMMPPMAAIRALHVVLELLLALPEPNLRRLPSLCLELPSTCLKTFCSLLCCTAITPAKTARSTAIQKGTKASRANTTSNPAFQTHSLQPPPCFLSSSFLPATFLQTLYASCCVACDRETCPGHIQHSQRMMAQGDDSGFRQTLPPFQGLCPSPGQGCR